MHEPASSATPTTSSRRPVRITAGGLAVAVLLPALAPGAAAAQSTPTAVAAAKPLPPLSQKPVVARAQLQKRLKSRTHHTVRSGESLWTIAAGIAGPNASPTRIANVLVAVWNANDVHIGTGDPDLLPVGVKLHIPASVRH